MEKKVLHSSALPTPELRSHVHVILSRPEMGGNVGSAARAIENMGIEGSYSIVGKPEIINASCRRMAKHAHERLDGARFFSTLKEALEAIGDSRLVLGATARIGSSHRPHPTTVRRAMPEAIQKLVLGDIRELCLVFGCESDGLSNEEIALCDWVVTIPSAKKYRSLNLAQAVLVFCYEANEVLLAQNPGTGPKVSHASQKGRLISHMLQLAEEVGFIFPGDPFKMRPRLEEILSHLPNHLEDVKTLHGLIDQAVRTVRKGTVDLKGRYKHVPNRTEIQQ